MTWQGLELVAWGIPWTLAVTAGAFLLGAALGVPLCAMHVSRSRVLHGLAVALIVALRSIPPIVWLFLLYFGVGSGYLKVGAVQAAVVALGLITAANMAEIYRGALRSIHPGQWDAAQALGLPVRSELVDVIVPQVFRVTLPSAATYIIGLLKDSAIASTIGVAEITYLANFLSRKQFNESLTIFAFAGMLYILISLPLAALARLADGRLRARVAQ
ncbi:MAG: ABC transporter permease subunit [Rhodobacteraceae bacterium]|jgi:polar amino acid transport system permease protein|nr:ABC transporter permease subunit [Paracoccaceae bacterium]